MKIVKLTAENVKRIHAVEITPDGDLVIIGGQNAQGKTSVLDSIAMALGGGDTACGEPLRKGASKGRTVVELDDLVVTRTYTAAGGGTLTVASKEGAKYPSPQAVLDGLVGKLTFDPLAFSRMDPKRRLEMLREMVGINFTLLDGRKAKVFESRTMVNREVKQAEALLASLEHYQGAPSEEVSIGELSKQLNEAQEHNSKNKDIRAAQRERIADVETMTKRHVEAQAAFIAAQKRLEEATASLKAEEQGRDEHAEIVATLTDVDTGPLISQLENVEFTNRKVRANKGYVEAKTRLNAKQNESAELTRELEQIEDKKKVRLAQTKFPVDGLSLTDDGVIFNGVPFNQASGAEQLRVSVAIGIAANPKLKVLLCRDGSLLDDKSLQLLAGIVKEHNYQLWLERVGEGKECAVIIEDGYVKEAS